MSLRWNMEKRARERAFFILIVAILLLFLPQMFLTSGGRVQAFVADEYISRYERMEQQFPGVFYMAGPEHSSKVALSFDDGPLPGNTPDILDILNEYDIPATFFMLGQEVEASPWLVEKVAEHGHEIGNHSFTHRDFTKLDRETIWEEEIKPTGEMIEEITGEYPTLVRPPYGSITGEQMEKLGEKGYKVVNWSVDIGDYELENQPEMLLARLQVQMHPGAIILLHDGGGDRTNTIKMLPEMIEMLMKEGYEFTTVGELISRRDR